VHSFGLRITFLVYLSMAGTNARAHVCQNLSKSFGQSLQKTSIQYTFSGREHSLRDLEQIFKQAVAGQNYEIVIPKKVRLNLFRTEPAYSVRYSERRVDYFPYRLGDAKSEDSKYLHDHLEALRDSLSMIERSQKSKSPLGDIWKFNLDGQFFFTQSPTAAASNRLFQRADRLLAVIDRTERLGRFPFMHIKENGDMVLTNEHFFEYLKRGGSRAITLYRGHHSFDYYFYNLLLKKEKDLKQLRSNFADWLEDQSLNLSISRNTERSQIQDFISRLNNKKEPIVAILSEMSKQLTTSAMFTSLTNATSAYWANGKNLSEIIQLKLDLRKIPDWYLKQILYGSDLEVEIVLPFATQSQIEALQNSLTIQRSRKP
jgi:hypothetical protein